MHKEKEKERRGNCKQKKKAGGLSYGMKNYEVAEMKIACL